MLPPEPLVLTGRQAFTESQPALQSLGAPRPIGSFSVSWYGTEVSDERGSFAVVSSSGSLALMVGNVLRVVYQRRDVYVYVIGTYSDLLTDLGLTRRAFMEIANPSFDPILAPIEVVR